jgi:gamma-glutamyltranspeptidase / glutathione hydrolase
LRWEEVVAPAERLARFDHKVSRAMAADIAAWGQQVPLPGWDRIDPRRAEGVTVQQLALSSALGTLRTRGAGAFFQGSLGSAFADVAGVRINALGTARPRSETPVSTVSFSRVRSMVPTEAAQSAGPTAGLIALDANGNAVACRFSMGGLFGTGRPVLVAGLLVSRPTPVETLAGVGIAFGQSMNEVIGVVSAGDAADRAELLSAVEGGEIEAGPVMARFARGGNLATAGFCPKGVSAGCRASSDPRGHGLALDLVR